MLKNITSVISSRKSYEWSLGVSPFFFLSFFFFLYKDIIFTIILQFSRDQESTLIFSCTVTVGAPCGTRGPLIADITVSSLEHLEDFETRTIRLGHGAAPFRDTTIRRTEGILFFFFFFSPHLNSSLPRILPSPLFPSLSFLFSIFFLLSFFLFTSRVFPSQWGCPMLRLHTMRAKFDVLFSFLSLPLSLLSNIRRP